MRVNANALSLHPKQIHACIFFSCMPNQQNWLYFPMVVLILPTFLLQSFHYIYIYTRVSNRFFLFPRYKLLKYTELLNIRTYFEYFSFQID